MDNINLKQLESKEKEIVNFITNKLVEKQPLLFSRYRFLLYTEMLENVHLQWSTNLRNLTICIISDIKIPYEIIRLNEWNNDYKNWLGKQIQKQFNLCVEPKIRFILNNIILFDSYSKNLYALSNYIYCLNILLNLKSMLVIQTKKIYETNKYEEVINLLQLIQKNYNPIYKNWRINQILLKLEKEITQLESKFNYNDYLNDCGQFGLIFKECFNIIRQIIVYDEFFLINFLNDDLIETIIDTFCCDYCKDHKKQTKELMHQINKFKSNIKDVNFKISQGENVLLLLNWLVDEFNQCLKAIAEIINDKDWLLTLCKYLIEEFECFVLIYKLNISFDRKEIRNIRKTKNLEIDNEVKQLEIKINKHFQFQDKIPNEIKLAFNKFEKSISNIINKEKKDINFLIGCLIKMLEIDYDDDNKSWCFDEIKRLKLIQKRFI